MSLLKINLKKRKNKPAGSFFILYIYILETTWVPLTQYWILPLFYKSITFTTPYKMARLEGAIWFANKCSNLCKYISIPAPLGTFRTIIPDSLDNPFIWLHGFIKFFPFRALFTLFWWMQWLFEYSEITLFLTVTGTPPTFTVR